MEDNLRILLEKKLCHILRHRPQMYGLVLDYQGFCDLNDICRVINISKDELDEVIRLSNKQRFEIKGDKIRALYGHSFENKITKDEIITPPYLYHGTTSNAYEYIKNQGLKPMNRQYVHLSIDVETAEQVGKRREENPYILRINASKASKDGIKFFKGNDSTILANEIPSEYIELINHKKFKGIFWIVDQNDLDNNDDYFFRIEINDDGNIVDSQRELTSKNKDNYNHKLTWQSLPKSLTHNKDFNYYPRGRVENKNSKYKIYVNPVLTEERIIDYIKQNFGLSDKDNVLIIADNSNHYQSEI